MVKYFVSFERNAGNSSLLESYSSSLYRAWARHSFFLGFLSSVVWFLCLLPDLCLACLDEYRPSTAILSWLLLASVSRFI